MIHEDEALANEIMALAQEVVMRGVIQGELSPNNAHDQIIVTGAMIILAAARANLSIGEALSRVVGNADVIDSINNRADSNSDGHPGQYL